MEGGDFRAGSAHRAVPLRQHDDAPMSVHYRAEARVRVRVRVRVRGRVSPGTAGNVLKGELGLPQGAAM